MSAPCHLPVTVLCVHMKGVIIIVKGVIIAQTHYMCAHKKINWVQVYRRPLRVRAGKYVYSTVDGRPLSRKSRPMSTTTHACVCNTGNKHYQEMLLSCTLHKKCNLVTTSYQNLALSFCMACYVANWIVVGPNTLYTLTPDIAQGFTISSHCLIMGGFI